MHLKKIIPSYLVLILIVSVFYFLNQKLVDYGFLIDENRVLFNSFSLIGIVESFFMFCLIIPILEELSFRAFLVKSEKDIYLGISFFCRFPYSKF
jgi:membrane protease YdiL (CAAX protease family)